MSTRSANCPLDAKEANKLCQLVTNTVQVLLKSTLLPYHPNDQFHLKGLLCLSTEQGDLWHFSIDDKFDTYESAKLPNARSCSPTNDHQHGNSKNGAGKDTKIRDSHTKKLSQSEKKIKNKSAVHIPARDSQREYPRKMDKNADIETKFAAADVYGPKVSEKKDVVSCDSDSNDVIIKKENSDCMDQWQYMLPNQPVFPAVRPLVVAPDFMFPPTSEPQISTRPTEIEPSPMKKLKMSSEYSSPKKTSPSAVALAIMRTEGSFVTTRMISRRTGYKVSTIKTSFFSLSSEPSLENHIGIAEHVTGTSSLVFYKCPPSQIDPITLDKYKLSVSQYDVIYHSVPKNQLSLTHVRQILKCSPYLSGSESVLQTQLKSGAEDTIQVDADEGICEELPLNIASFKTEGEKVEELTSDLGDNTPSRVISLQEPSDSTPPRVGSLHEREYDDTQSDNTEIFSDQAVTKLLPTNDDKLVFPQFHEQDVENSSGECSNSPCPTNGPTSSWKETFSQHLDEPLTSDVSGVNDEPPPTAFLKQLQTLVHSFANK